MRGEQKRIILYDLSHPHAHVHCLVVGQAVIRLASTYFERKNGRLVRIGWCMFLDYSSKRISQMNARIYLPPSRLVSSHLICPSVSHSSRLRHVHSDDLTERVHHILTRNSQDMYLSTKRLHGWVAKHGP